MPEHLVIFRQAETRGPTLTLLRATSSSAVQFSPVRVVVTRLSDIQQYKTKRFFLSEGETLTARNSVVAVLREGVAQICFGASTEMWVRITSASTCGGATGAIQTMKENVFDAVIGRGTLKWDAVWRMLEWMAELYRKSHAASGEKLRSLPTPPLVGCKSHA